MLKERNLPKPVTRRAGLLALLKTYLYLPPIVFMQIITLGRVSGAWRRKFRLKKYVFSFVKVLFPPPLDKSSFFITTQVERTNQKENRKTYTF